MYDEMFFKWLQCNLLGLKIAEIDIFRYYQY